MATSYYLELSAILIAATALAWWCGWGIARLATPLSLRAYRTLLAPLFGYVVVIVGGYWGVRTVAGLPVVLPLILLATGALNVAAWRRAGFFRPRLQLREQLPLALLLLATLLVGIAPLLHYGHPAIIGAGWDTENYLPLARYLERGPLSAIVQAPPNPLRDINANPPRIGLTLGFSVWQGSVDLLARSEALTSFAPLLAWLRALGVLAVYLLLRGALGLNRGAALLGAAWTSAGALFLWVSYFNFGMQLAAWPLIPLALLLGVTAVEEVAAREWQGWVAVAGAALAVGALPIAYYPALTLWAPLAVGLGVALLLQSTHKLRLVLGAIAIAGLSVLVAAPTIADYGGGFAFRYSNQLTTLGLFRYIPLTDILGLTPFSLRQETPPARVWEMVALAALAGLMVAGLLAGPSRGRWLGVTAGGLAYLAWLRWGQQYPYAYMKGSAYAAFGFLGLAAAGWQAIGTRLPSRLRVPAAVAPLLLLALMGGSQARTVAAHWEEPGLYADELPALLELRRLVPAGSTVTLTSDPRVRGVTTGLAAYALDHATVLGYAKTGYSSSVGGEPDAIGEYGLLLAAEDPAPWGYAEPIWRGGSYALYRRPPGVRAHLRPDRGLVSGEAVALAVGDDRLALEPANLEGGQARKLEIAVATLEAGEVAVGDRRFSVPAGESLVRTTVARTPEQLEVGNSGQTPLTLHYITLWDETMAESDGVSPVQGAVVAQARSTAENQTVTTMIEALLPDSGPVTFALDIWDTPRGLHYGWYGVELGAAPTTQTITMTLNPQSGAMEARGADGAALPLGAQFEELQFGEYVARLQVGAGSLALAPPADLFSFRVERDGTIAEVQASAASVRTTTDRPPNPLDLRVGDDVRLRGYDLSTATAHAGDTVTLTLWWEALAAGLDERSVLLHLRDSAGAKVAQADGPPAQGARPTSLWQAQEVIIDRRQLTLPPDIPPGQYTLAVGMYRWPSLEALPVMLGDTRQEGDVARIPLTVEP